MTPNRAEIEPLLSKTWEELKSTPMDAVMEMSLVDLRNYRSEKEQFSILWDLAFDAIKDPAAEKQYIDTIKVSHTRNVIAEGVRAQLERVVKTITAPVFSLKVGGPKASKADQGTFVVGQPTITPKEIFAPSVKERFYSAAIDLGFCALVTALLASMALFFFEPEWRARMFWPLGWNQIELLSMLITLLPLFVINLVITPLLSGARTVGQKIYDLELLSGDGMPPTTAALVRRSLVFPVGLIMHIFKINRWDEPAFHDLVAFTRISRRYE